MAKLQQSIIDRSRLDALAAKQAELLARFEELRSEVGAGITTYRTTLAPSGAVTSFGVEEDLRTQAGRNQLAIESPKPKPAPKIRHAGATELLGELLPPQPPEEVNPPEPPQSWQGEQRYREIARETESITEALRILGPEIEKERRAYSERVLAQRADGYKEIASGIVDAAQALGNALMEHYSFIDELRLSGVEWRRMRRLDLGAFGDLSESHTPLKKLILSAVEQGHVDGSKIPAWRLPASIQILGDF